jgi:hypothetical protein
MSKKTMITAAWLFIIMFGLPGAATVESGSCPIFKVIVWGHFLEIESVKCIHGKIDRQTQYAVWLKQSLTNGPDCVITFRRTRDNKSTSYRFHQGFCFFKAGNITVEKVNGDFNLEYMVIRGSYTENKMGEVRITATQ